jgi:NSS family neurotransmitter:Na+ symporter
MDWFGGRDFLSLMDFLFGNVSLLLGGLFLAVLVGWVWGTRPATEELLSGAHPALVRLAPGWAFLLKFVCPAIIALVLLNLTGVFG